MFEIRQSLPAHMQDDFCPTRFRDSEEKSSEQPPSCSEDEEFEML
jgi:hypothetical protein